jgi:hypothetical protein
MQRDILRNSDDAPTPRGSGLFQGSEPIDGVHDRRAEGKKDDDVTDGDKGDDDTTDSDKVDSDTVDKGDTTDKHDTDNKD